MLVAATFLYQAVLPNKIMLLVGFGTKTVKQWHFCNLLLHFETGGHMVTLNGQNAEGNADHVMGAKELLLPYLLASPVHSQIRFVTKIAQ